MTATYEARMHLPQGDDDTRHLEAVLEILTESNAEWFASHPEAPLRVVCIVNPRVKYKPPPKGIVCQNYWSAPQVLKRRRGTCADLAAYDAGAARARGVPAYVKLEPVGPGDWHAVAIINGIRVDPSEQVKRGERC